MPNISVLLVDDHNIVRQGLRALLIAEGDITIVAEAQTGREAPVPESLARLLALPRQETELDPTLDALRAELQKN